MLRHAVGEEIAARFSFLLAGDVIEKKKPAPDIYLLAAKRFGAAPGECLAIEDSSHGLMAAVAAGIKCVVTVSGYTQGEDFSAADLVLTGLGDPGGEPCRVFANRSAARPGAYFRVDDLSHVLSRPSAR